MQNRNRVCEVPIPAPPSEALWLRRQPGSLKMRRTLSARGATCRLTHLIWTTWCLLLACGSQDRPTLDVTASTLALARRARQSLESLRHPLNLNLHPKVSAASSRTVQVLRCAGCRRLKTPTTSGRKAHRNKSANGSRQLLTSGARRKRQVNGNKRRAKRGSLEGCLVAKSEKVACCLSDLLLKGGPFL